MKMWRNSALGALGIMAASAVMAIAPTASAAPAAGPATQEAVANFGSCMAAEGKGDLLLLIDESASLKSSDPGGARVTAATHLLDQLSSYGENSGVKVNVAIAGFSDNYAVHSALSELNSGSRPAMGATVEAFRDRQSGQDTDYKMALGGALATLADGGATARGCQAIVWLTDGKLDFTVRDGSKDYAPGISMNSDAGVQQLITSASDSICRDGGVADQVRSSGITTFAIGLANGTAGDADFNLMRGIATGESADGTNCGKILTPSPGAFFLAKNIDDLLFAFDAFSTPGQAPLQQTAGVCGAELCSEGAHRFVLDNSISEVSVLANGGAEGLVATIESPSGQRVPLDNRTGESKLQIGGVDVSYQWKSPTSVTFSLSNAEAAEWPGVWSLVFSDPTGAGKNAVSKSNIHIFGNLFPALRDAEGKTFHTGEKTSLQLGIVDLERKPIDPSKLLGQATMSATLIAPDGTERPVAGPIGKESLAQPVAFDLTGVDPGNAKLRLTLNVTTSDAALPGGGREPGTALAPESIDIPLVIAPPLGYPTLPTMIDFGTVEGAGAFTVTPAITGGGCVWLDSSRPAQVAASPDGIGAIAVSSATANSKESCLTVPEGSSAQLPLEMNLENAANGVVNGTVALSIMPANSTGDVLSVDVPFTAQAQKPLNTSRFWLALVLALILGPGIPLLLLYLSKWLTAKIPAQPLKIQRFEVEVANQTVLRDGVPFELADRDLIEVVRGLSTAARSVSADGVELSTHVGRSPFGAGYATAHVPGKVGASGSLPATDPRTGDARLPLAVHNNWFVAHDPAGPENKATLVLLVAGTAGPEQVQQVVEDARQKLPNVLAQLRANSSASGATGPSDSGSNPFSAGPAGGGQPVQNPFAGPAGMGQPPQAGPPSGGYEPPSGNPFAPPPGNPFEPRNSQ